MSRESAVEGSGSLAMFGALAGSELHDVLAPVFAGHDSCVLLDYPDYLNVGDHLIWLSTLRFLKRKQITPSYCASLVNFSSDEMRRSAYATVPIVLQGGGNLGDLWPDCQLFREKIISQYRDRPIVVFPQSVYFLYEENAQRAKEVFNAHPDLTLLVREQESFRIATSLFTRCRVFMTPDTTMWDAARVIAGSQGGASSKGRTQVLYLRRGDAEGSRNFHAADLNLSEVRVEDWRPYSWTYAGRDRMRDYDEWYWRIPGAVDIYREGWQRGLSRPTEYLSRLKWELLNPFATHLRQIAGSRMHWFSWRLLHDAISQIKHCRLVVTDRLHGQIMAHLCGVPSILLPNAYHKNSSYFATWMQKYADCQFAATSGQLRTAVNKLLDTG